MVLMLLCVAAVAWLLAVIMAVNRTSVLANLAFIVVAPVLMERVISTVCPQIAGG